MWPRFGHGQPDELRTMHPAYFALVMATGIVAIASWLHGVPIIPTVLFWLTAAFFVVVTGATLLRLRRYPEAVLADIRSHSRGVGFFTMVAACGVFGSQLVLQMEAPGLALIFWLAAAILWLLLTYGIFAVLTVLPEKPSLSEGLNGGWLVSVVATQSVAILTVTLVPEVLPATLAPAFLFLALILWLGGGALYLWLMTLIFFRYTFMRMSPADLTPPYWINMGAVAISTLAGATLLAHAAHSPIVSELTSFIGGLTLFFWAIGSWWIPMLLVLGVWRYLLRGVPFTYDPLYWGGVFPLGMYAVCTYRLTQVMDAAFLMPLSFAFMVIAILAWTVTFVGMVDSRLARRGAAGTRSPVRRGTSQENSR